MAATAERLIAGREETQAPLRGLAHDHARARTRVDEATRAKTDVPVGSPRLERALADKAATDAAVVAKSAERGCVENCRKLLQAQADAAEQEVARAREEIARKASDADQAIANARRDLEAMRVPASAAPLADRLGWEPWVLDLVIAALGSVAANGLACFLIGCWSYDLALHRNLLTVLKAERAALCVTESLPVSPDGRRLRAA